VSACTHGGRQINEKKKKLYIPFTPALFVYLKQKFMPDQAPVAYTCNPSYLGSRDQEDWNSKPASGKYFARPYLENTQHIKGLVEWLKW
jgi:hypothetical protein